MCPSHFIAPCLSSFLLSNISHTEAVILYFCYSALCTLHSALTILACPHSLTHSLSFTHSTLAMHGPLFLPLLLFLALLPEAAAQITTTPRDQPRQLHLRGIEACCQYQDDPSRLLQCANSSSYRNMDAVLRDMYGQGGPTLGECYCMLYSLISATS